MTEIAIDSVQLDRVAGLLDGIVLLLGLLVLFCAIAFAIKCGEWRK